MRTTKHWMNLEAVIVLIFFFNDTPTTEIYTLSLHDALPISRAGLEVHRLDNHGGRAGRRRELVQGDLRTEPRRTGLPPVGDDETVAEALGLEVRAVARVGADQEIRTRAEDHPAERGQDHD